MGLLIQGKPYKWSDMEKYRAYIKKHGIQQFINVWNGFKDRNSDVFLWGDEIECLVLDLDHENNKARIALRAGDILADLEHAQEHNETLHAGSGWNVTYHPEYGNFMVEVTPGTPYGSYTSDLRMVENNMRLRRALIQSKLKNGEIIVTMSNYPLLGTEDSTSPAYPINGPILKSQYVSDAIMAPHPRFGALSGNIRRRRGKRVNIKMPLYIDVNTDLSGKHNKVALDEREELRATPKEIHMDAMGFGMGCCCLQVTFQTRNILEARHLYDQLAVVGPILLALSAATPIHRGLFANTDVRWNTISQSVDDRTEAEQGLCPLKTELTPATPISPPLSPRDAPELSPFDITTSNSFCELHLQEEDHPSVGVRNDTVSPLLTKSRYSSIDTYLGNSTQYKDTYNDLPFFYDGTAYDKLRLAGVDEQLSKHIASLFTRDPLVAFEGKIEVDDAVTTEHFESIQSTNWRSVRFKPPPLNGPIGWRVEFRTMEIQSNDFDNAAYTVFVTLLSRAICFFHLNQYIPLSKVEENFAFAHEHNAAREKSFYFRKTVKANDGNECNVPLTPLVGSLKSGFVWEKQDCSTIIADDFSLSNEKTNTDTNTSTSTTSKNNNNDEYTMMTMQEIMCGKKCPLGSSCYPGLIPIVRAYLHVINCDSITKRIVERYLNFLEMKSQGRIPTTAQWTRKVLYNHPEYKQDSVVTSKMNYDLACMTDLIGKNALYCYELSGGCDLDANDEDVVIYCLKEEDVLLVQPQHQALCVVMNGQKYPTPSVAKPVYIARLDFHHPFITHLINMYQTIYASNQEQAKIIAQIDECIQGTAKSVQASPAKSVSNVSLCCELSRTPSACQLLNSGTLTKQQAEHQLRSPNGSLMAGNVMDYTSGQYPDTPIPLTLQNLAQMPCELQYEE